MSQRAVLAVAVLAIGPLLGTPTAYADDAVDGSGVTASEYGPDGTHYPSATPDIRGSLDAFHVVDVPADAAAVRAALDALTTQQIDAGAVIRIEPGAIADISALNGYHNERATKVLIMARDGFETVVGSQPWKLLDVAGITLMRLDISSINLKGARHSSIAWVRARDGWVGVSATKAFDAGDVELVEVVAPESTVKSSDTAQVKAYEGSQLSGVLIEGSYFAPSFYLDGDYGPGGQRRPHTDTLQIDGSGITDDGVVLRDNVVFTSNNAAVIIGGVPAVSFDHDLIVASRVAQHRYPFKEGGAGFSTSLAGPGSLSAVQGHGGGGVTATGSTFIGSLQPKWETVTDSRTNLQGKKAANGGFTYDPTLSQWTAAELDAVSTYPRPEYLRSIWDDRAGTLSPAPSAGRPPSEAEATPRPTASGSPSPSGIPSVSPSPSAAPSDPAEQRPPTIFELFLQWLLGGGNAPQ